jgi:hypothetical protein
VRLHLQSGWLQDAPGRELKAFSSSSRVDSVDWVDWFKWIESVNLNQPVNLSTIQLPIGYCFPSKVKSIGLLSGESGEVFLEIKESILCFIRFI